MAEKTMVMRVSLFSQEIRSRKMHSKIGAEFTAEFASRYQMRQLSADHRAPSRCFNVSCSKLELWILLALDGEFGVISAARLSRCVKASIAKHLSDPLNLPSVVARSVKSEGSVYVCHHRARESITA